MNLLTRFPQLKLTTTHLPVLEHMNSTDSDELDGSYSGQWIVDMRWVVLIRCYILCDNDDNKDNGRSRANDAIKDVQ